MPQKPQAVMQVVLPSQDLTADMDFFSHLGFRLDNIYPSDDPRVAYMSGHRLHLRLDKDASVELPELRLQTDNPEHFGKEKLVAPNGTTIKLEPLTYQLEMPETRHQFEVRKLTDSDPWVIGRAGMLYRDLIQGRLGGSIIASHIRIPDGGPVPDMVHYHTIGFQLIFCYRGWVKLVYEDQGPPFILNAGDCVTQPPKIRHRVLEASDNLEVIEIGVPADHMTTIDHDLELPTQNLHPDREFGGQVFCHHEVNKADWTPWRLKGFTCRDTGINKATRSVASVQVINPTEGGIDSPVSSHNTNILFTFVMEGTFELQTKRDSSHELKAGDAFVIPPDFKYQYKHVSSDLELLEVALPGTFKTLIHE